MSSVDFRGRVLDAATVIVAACSVIVCFAVVAGRFAKPPAQAAADEQVTNWHRFATEGHRIGDASSAVSIVEFGDYQCPACAHFETVLRKYELAQPGVISVIYRHFPLSYHEYARGAAMAAECAADQGRFEEVHRLMYDSAAYKRPLAFITAAAQIPDTAAFFACVRTEAKADVIERDIAAAQAAGATGTPTLIVEGLRLGLVPDSAKLDDVIRRALKKRADASR